MPRDFNSRFPSSDSTRSLSWGLRQEILNPLKVPLSLDSNHVVHSEIVSKISPSRKGEDNTPGRCFSMLIFAVALLCCFVVCNYTRSKMFVMIWKYIKADTCPPSLTCHNVTARVSCPCFVYSEQYVVLRQGVQPHHPLDEEIHLYQHPSVLMPHHRCTILYKKYS